MAEDKKYKITTLLLGVLIGLVVGMMALIVMQSLNRDNSKGKNDMSETAIERIADKVLTMFYLKKSTEDPKNPEQKIVYVKDKNSGKENNTEIDSTKNIVTENISENDSLSITIDSSNYDNNSEISNENIQVKKDRLIAAKTFEITAIGNLDLKTPTDSILEKTSGVQIDKNTSKKVMVNVELWESPINYKGYKMNKSKTVLFGFPDMDFLKLYIIDGEYYAKYEANVYRLQNTNDFKSYEKVNKANILSQIK